MFKSKQLSINLLPQDPFFDSYLGRTLQWSMGAGRYIVIFTELIVILSFAARFTLDRQVTDYNEKLHGQIQQLEGMATDEAAFRLAQAQLGQIRANQDVSNILDVFSALNAVVPSEVVIDQLSISQSSLSLTGTAITQPAFITFINNLQLTPQFNSINIGKIESTGKSETGFSFSLTAATRVAPTVAIESKPENTDATGTPAEENPPTKE